MIDPVLKRSLGQMAKGVQVVGASSGDGSIRRLYTSHWVCQVAFEEPIVMASVSPRHDTHALIAETGLFSVSILAGDQVAEGQYFSYPGRRFAYVAQEYVDGWNGLPIVPNALAYLRCEVFERKAVADHELFFTRVVDTRAGRLREPPLVYSSRHGWRIAAEKAREPGTGIRDRLLARLDLDPYELEAETDE